MNMQLSKGAREPTDNHSRGGKPATSGQNSSETFTDFTLRMQSEYNVQVTCDPSSTVTLKEQGYIEKALSLWGKDFVKIVSAGFGKKQLRIRITDDDGVYYSGGEGGATAENYKGPWCESNPENYLTEIQYPVRKAMDRP